MRFPINLKFAFLLTSILCAFCGYSQRNKGLEVPVIDVLKDLEQSFDVSFSFSDSVLNDITVSNLQGNSIDDHLSLIEGQTLIEFKRLNERFIAVKYVENKPISICGYIKNSEFKDPVSEVIIQSNRGIALTNQDGYFEIDQIAANDSILIQRLGYDSRFVLAKSLKSNECVHLFLHERIPSLKQVVITNYLTQGISLSPGGTFTLETKKFGMLPGLLEPDILHSIQSLPGIQSFNESISNINIRGGTNDQNLVLWNNIRMYQTGHFFGLISAFNPYLANRVNIIKNGTPSAYGAGVSGTIDIHTDKNVSGEPSGTVGLNMLNGDLLMKLPLSENSSVILSGRHSLSKLWQTPTYRSYFKRAFRDSELKNSNSNAIIGNDEFRFYDYSINYLLHVNDTDKLQASFLRVKNKLQFTEEVPLKAPRVQKTSSLRQISNAGGLYYKKQWSQKVNSTFDLYLSQYELDAINNDISNDQVLEQINEVVDFGGKMSTGILVEEQTDLTLGYEYNDIGITNEEILNSPDFKRLERDIIRKHSLFSQITHESRKNNSFISVGSRATYLKKFDLLLIEPRLAISQPLSDRFSIEILGELKNQTTSQIIDFQTDFLGVEKRRWVLSNEEDIPVIKSNQLSLGLNYNFQKWLITLESYQKNVNSIITSSQGFLNQFQFIRSTGDYQVYGLDFLINRRTDLNSTWISYAIARNIYEFSELQPVTFPNNLDITHSFTGGTNFNYKNWCSSVGFNYRTGAPFTGLDPQVEIINRTINYGIPNDHRIDPYLRLDVSLKYNFTIFKEKEAQIGLSIWNVTNRDNTTSIFYQLDSDTQVSRIKRGALGRTINVGFRINF